MSRLPIETGAGSTYRKKLRAACGHGSTVKWYGLNGKGALEETSCCQKNTYKLPKVVVKNEVYILCMYQRPTRLHRRKPLHWALSLISRQVFAAKLCINWEIIVPIAKTRMIHGQMIDCLMEEFESSSSAAKSTRVSIEDIKTARGEVPDSLRPAYPPLCHLSDRKQRPDSSNLIIVA